jgi:hypothetical protein
VFYTFSQNYSSLQFNVTVVHQTDQYGYGPSYLLNGATNKNYWYQVGIAWNWIKYGIAGHNNGSEFTYQVFNPNGTSIFPITGVSETLPMDFATSNNDIILLELNFTGSDVIMFAKDWNTSGTEMMSYPSMGATEFVKGYSTQENTTYFSGPMEEWYHPVPYLCNRQTVTFRTNSLQISEGMICMDEYNNSGLPIQEWFTNRTSLVYDRCTSSLQEPSTSFLNFRYTVANASSNDEEFVISG